DKPGSATQHEGPSGVETAQEVFHVMHSLQREIEKKGARSFLIGQFLSPSLDSCNTSIENRRLRQGYAMPAFVRLAALWAWRVYKAKERGESMPMWRSILGL
ncbi:unnamed protein product, partial [Hapterophycus canaliculatus]